MSAASWYEIVDESTLDQGDFFSDCQVITPYSVVEGGIPTPVIKARADFYDVVLLSQSCDLAQDKLDFVLACRYEPLDVLPRLLGRPEMVGKELKNARENARRGIYPAIHMLNSCSEEGFSHGVQLVDFRYIFSLPREYIVHRAETTHPRLRLRSPYKEHLSQAFARYFMRVGLPSDIPKFV